MSSLLKGAKKALLVIAVSVVAIPILLFAAFYLFAMFSFNHPAWVRHLLHEHGQSQDVVFHRKNVLKVPDQWLVWPENLTGNTTITSFRLDTWESVNASKNVPDIRIAWLKRSESGMAATNATAESVAHHVVQRMHDIDLRWLDDLKKPDSPDSPLGLRMLRALINEDLMRSENGTTPLPDDASDELKQKTWSEWAHRLVSMHGSIRILPGSSRESGTAIETETIQAGSLLVSKRYQFMPFDGGLLVLEDASSSQQDKKIIDRQMADLKDRLELIHPPIARGQEWVVQKNGDLDSVPPSERDHHQK